MIQLSGSKPAENGGSKPALISGMVGWVGAPVILEGLACFLVCACFAAVPAPDINESHYLTRALHFQDPASFPRDLFLQSTDAQWLFFFATGWLTTVVSLESFAWIGRVVSWLMLSAAFVFLARSVKVRGILVPAILCLMFVLVRRGNLAGEWVVGGFEAKTIAWPLVLMATGYASRERWSIAWCLCGAAAAFHFVVGWWAIVCLAICRLILFSREDSSRLAGTGLVRIPGWFRELVMGRRAVSGSGRSLLLVFAITIAGLVGGALPMLLDGAGVSYGDSVTAARIQVFQRLPHHLYFGDFAASRVASFAVLVLVWLFMSFRVAMNAPLRMVGTLGLVTLGLDLAGLLLSGIAEGNGYWSELATSLLRLYWFRMADVFLPLSVALMCGLVLGNWSSGGGLVHRRIARGVVGLLLVAACLEGVEKFSVTIPPADAVGVGAVESDSRRAEETVRNWQRVCEWCRDNTPAGALILTPYGQQTFSWYSERSEWFSWKHAPQDAAGLMEWNRRRETFLILQNRYGTEIPGWPEGVLKWLMDQERLDYAIVPQREIDRWGVPRGMAMVYPESGSIKRTFCVLRPVIAGLPDAN